MATIAALCGSLRAQSSNAALLRAAAQLLPAGVEMVFFHALGTLPHFNPDLDSEGREPPEPVAQFRALLRTAQGCVISTPEYAHGVPGSFKNALDWVVSSGELVDKPVLLLNASPLGGEMAQASLVATLEVMSARVLKDASRLAPFVRKKLVLGEAPDEQTSRLLEASLNALALAVGAR